MDSTKNFQGRPAFFFSFRLWSPSLERFPDDPCGGLAVCRERSVRWHRKGRRCHRHCRKVLPLSFSLAISLPLRFPDLTETLTFYFFPFLLFIKVISLCYLSPFPHDVFVFRFPLLGFAFCRRWWNRGIAIVSWKQETHPFLLSISRSHASKIFFSAPCQTSSIETKLYKFPLSYTSTWIFTSKEKVIKLKIRLTSVCHFFIISKFFFRIMLLQRRLECTWNAENLWWGISLKFASRLRITHENS